MIMMRHHCLICNNKHPDILYPTREEGLRAKADHEKAISILRKLFFLPPEVEDDLTLASYCFNCTTKLCQLQEVYDQIELCQATIVQSRREVEMSLIKASFMDQNCHDQDQKGQDDVQRTRRENDENGTNHTRKLLCNLIHYKPPSVDDYKLEESDDGVESKRTEFNENSSEEMTLKDEIGHAEVEAGSGAGEQSISISTADVVEDIVENTGLESCSSTSSGDTDDIMVIVTDDISTIDKNASSHDEDEEMPFLISFSAINGGDEDEHMEEVDDENGNPPLIDKFDQTRTLKRKATLADLTISDEINGLDSGFGDEQLTNKKFKLIDDEKTRYLKRQCISRKCQVVLQTLKSPIQIKHITATPTFTFNKKKGPGQGRGKANFSSPMKVTVSGDSTLIVMDKDVNPTNNEEKKTETEKSILVPADKVKTPNINVSRRVRFRSPISSIKTFTSEPDLVNNKLKGRQGLKRKRKINVKVKLVGKNLIRSRKSKITPVLNSYKPNSLFFNDDTSFNAQIQTQNSENESALLPISIPNSRATAVMEKIRNSEALLKSKLNFRRTVPVKKRKKSKVKSISTSTSTTLSANSPSNLYFCLCGKEFKLEWRYNNHLKLHPTHAQLDSITISKPTKSTVNVNNDKMCELCENPIASRLYKRHLAICQIRSKNSESVIKKQKNKPKIGRQSSYDKLLQIGKNVKKAVGIRASFLSHSQAKVVDLDEYENENSQSARVIPVPLQYNMATTTTDEHDDQDLNSTEIAQNTNTIYKNSENESESEPAQNSETLLTPGSGVAKKFEIYESPNISFSDFEDKTVPKSLATATATDESSDGESPKSKSAKEPKYDTVFRCPYTECELQVIGKVDLIAHLKYHMGLPSNSTSGPQNSKFRCPYVDCEVLSEDKATLIAHLKVHMEV